MAFWLNTAEKDTDYCPREAVDVSIAQLILKGEDSFLFQLQHYCIAATGLFW